VTPSEKNIVKALIAVAWADGKLERPESGVIEGLLCGFDASPDEERELTQYAAERRTLSSDVPVAEMNREDREILLGNAALLTHADGEQSASERSVLDDLVKLLQFEPDEADAIIASARDGALQLSSRSLQD
jgi:tellurite resistance protein